jgi:threonine dehydratase
MGGAETSSPRRGVAFELVRRTPVVAWPGRTEVSLKLESLQRTGSFKLRGAALRLDALSAEERARGVVVASAGNHGLGVALSARALGIRATVVVPETSVEVKRRGIAALGAEVIVEGAGYDDAEAAARARAAAADAVFVSAYDDPWVQRGNGGTLAEEILAQVPAVTQVAFPIGGGGLMTGLAEVLAPRGVALVGVQPEKNCAMHRSRELGRALTVYAGEPTIAEGCEGAVSEGTFAACVRHDVKTVLVSEDAIRRGVRFAYDAGWLVEPSSAVAIAGVLEGVVPPSARTVVVVTGSNVEPDLLGEILSRGSG